MRSLLIIVLLSIFLNHSVQVTTAGSLKKGDEILSYAERLPQENDTTMRHADVYLFKSKLEPDVHFANHWGLVFVFEDKNITIEGIRQGTKLQSKYSVINGTMPGKLYTLTEKVMRQKHDFLEKVIDCFTFGNAYAGKRKHLRGFLHGVTVSPKQLRDIAANNPCDDKEYKLVGRDCHTWAIEITKALAKYKNFEHLDAVYIG